MEQTSPGGVAAAKPEANKELAADGNTTDSKAKSKRKINPRPDLLDLHDVPLEQDNRRVGDGYNYTSKEQFAIDKAFVRASQQRARADIAMQLFGTASNAEPTKALEKFWKKTGVPKTKSLSEIVAIIINAPDVGWVQQYKMWRQLREDTPAWAAQAKILMELAIRINTPKQKPDPKKPTKPAKQPPSAT